VEASHSVNVVSRISGRITSVATTEGRMVGKGELLFTIDEAPYNAALAAAKANLEGNRVLLDKAKRDEARYAALLAKDYVTKDQAEQAQATAEALEATVKGNEAALETAKINLSYCRITAPFTGRAGAVLIHAGNIVKENDATTTLMVIHQVSPILVRFSVPERFLTDIRRKMGSAGLPVTATPPGAAAQQGRLTFLDNAVQADSGTIDLKATFENRADTLWPGMFVNVSLLLGTKTAAVTIPGAALQMGQEGAYVFVVKTNSTVEMRKITVGETVDGFAVVESGLSAGETVVTDGQVMLYPGAKVTTGGQPAREKRS
jgi:multidrug efflux system membrane fusion protein